MAFNVNDSSKKVVGGGLYTGVTNVKVSMINPSKEEMVKRNMNVQQEPVYTTQSNEGVKKTMLQFYLVKDSDKIYPKRAFWLEDKVRTNKEGTKYEWINKFGTTAWSESVSSPPNYTWFKTDGARPALVGEGKLTKFIKAWANVDPTSQACLDDPKAIAQGNIAEIIALQKAIPNNEVQVLLGVNNAVDKQGKPVSYQDVYDNHFERATNTDFSRWRTELAKDGQEFKSDFQGDLKYQPYTRNSGVAVDTPTNLDTPGDAAPAAGTGIPNF